MKRVANFYHSETPREGFTPIPVGEGRTAYVQGVITPAGTTLRTGFDYVPEWKDGDPNLMNCHFVSSRKVKQAKRSKDTVPTCEHCGSKDVRVDAYAVWDAGTQTWEVAGDVFDKGAVCEDCGGECTIKWRKP
mgnify:CR=1 FL=1